MNIEIVLVKEEEKSVLSHLMELYQYDFSDFEGTDVNQYGLYGYTYFDHYWTETKRFPYFFKVDGKLAGFVLVCDYCYVRKDEDALFMAEFFVMKKYRLKGIGKTAAMTVFKNHPGKWELTVHPKNPTSQLFWQRVIKETCSYYEVKTDVKDVYDHHLAHAYLFEVK